MGDGSEVFSVYGRVQERVKETGSFAILFHVRYCIFDLIPSSLHLRQYGLCTVFCWRFILYSYIQLARSTLVLVLNWKIYSGKKFNVLVGSELERHVWVLMFSLVENCASEVMVDSGLL